jgi:hypothetical protein
MLTELLAERRTSILKRWLGLILESYPAAQFLLSEKDRFANPVGQTIAREIEVVYDGVRSDAAIESYLPALEAIVRIRAVQDFSASRAVSFIFLLKQAIREAIATELAGGAMTEAILSLESRIDAVAGRCFDLHMDAREKIFEIRTTEMRRQTYFLLERAAGGDDKQKP